MTFKPASGIGGPVRIPERPRSAQQQFQDAMFPTAFLVVVVAVLTFFLGLSLTSLLPSMAAGLLIGWVRQWPFFNSRRTDALSALFASRWDRKQPLLTAIDVASRVLVGYGVGLALGSWAARHPSTPAPFSLLVYSGGSGGGGGADAGELWWMILALVILAAVVGMIGMLLTEGVMRKALYDVGQAAAEAAKRTAEETAGSIVEDAASAVYGRREESMLAAAFKGAINGAAICVVLMLLGFK